MRKISLLLVCAIGCAATQSSAPQSAAVPPRVEVVPIPPAPVEKLVPADRAPAYQALFPKAKRLVMRDIPAPLKESGDGANDTYVDAFDEHGNSLGSARAFSGGVAPDSSTRFGELHVILAFLSDGRLADLTANPPLTRQDGKPLSVTDMDRLIAIAKDPPDTLIAARNLNDLIDASGNTRPALTKVAVPGAPVLTRRVVSLVLATQRLLDRAPAARDHTRMEAVLHTATDDHGKAQGLAVFVGQAETRDAREQAYRDMAHLYALSLAHGDAKVDFVENAILGTGLREAPAGDDLVLAGYVLAERGLRPELAARCLEAARHSSIPADENNVARLAGTLAWAAHKYAEALPLLGQAAHSFNEETDPNLYLHLSQTHAALGHKTEACPIAQHIFLALPLLPGAKQALSACVANGAEPETAVKPMYALQREELLSTMRTDNIVPEPLSVDSPANTPVELLLGEIGHVTVAMFFSTWCPHCQAELPRVNTFFRLAAERWHERVRVIGIRTSIERETEPYEAFVARLHPSFPVFTDATMSIGFSGFCRALGLRAALPMIAVLDDKGMVRFVLGAGDYKDTARELEWAVEALLADKK